jgi:hypothetical protein
MNQHNHKYKYQLINIAKGFNRWYAIYDTQLNLHNKGCIIYTIHCNDQTQGFNLEL